ncbi:MAG: hypothetical protein Q8P67_15835, partial [archaeon]|nr:hypothetical protein [archaeon]
MSTALERVLSATVSMPASSGDRERLSRDEKANETVLLGAGDPVLPDSSPSEASSSSSSSTLTSTSTTKLRPFQSLTDALPYQSSSPNPSIAPTSTLGSSSSQSTTSPEHAALFRPYLRISSPCMTKPFETSWHVPEQGSPAVSFQAESFHIYGVALGEPLEFQLFHRYMDRRRGDRLIATGVHRVTRSQVFRSVPTEVSLSLQASDGLKRLLARFPPPKEPMLDFSISSSSTSASFSASFSTSSFATIPSPSTSSTSSPSSSSSSSSSGIFGQMGFRLEVVGLAQKPIMSAKCTVKRGRFFQHVEAIRLILKNPSQGSNVLFSMGFLLVILLLTSAFGPFRVFVSTLVFLVLALLQFTYYKTKMNHAAYVEDLRHLLVADESDESAKSTSLILNKVLKSFWKNGSRHYFNTVLLPQLNALIASRLNERAPPGKESPVQVTLKSVSTDAQFRPLISCVKTRGDDPNLFDVDFVVHWVGGPDNYLLLDAAASFPRIGHRTISLKLSRIYFRFDIRMSLSMHQVPFNANVFTLQFQNAESIRVPSVALLLGGAYYEVDILMGPFRHYVRQFFQSLINKHLLNPQKLQFRLDGTAIINEQFSESIDPITDLAVYFADIEDSLRPDWFPVSSLPPSAQGGAAGGGGVSGGGGGVPGDHTPLAISKGQTYICYTRHKDKPPITSIV